MKVSYGGVHAEISRQIVLKILFGSITEFCIYH